MHNRWRSSRMHLQDRKKFYEQYDKEHESDPLLTPQIDKLSNDEKELAV